MSALDGDGYITSFVRRVLPERHEPLPMRASDFFDVCATHRRRFVLLEVADTATKNPTTISKLANRLAVEENERPQTIEDITERQRKRCYVSLYQTNLRVLHEHGLVEWDRETGEVRRTKLTNAAAKVLRSMLADMDCDYRVYDRYEHVHRAADRDDLFDVLKADRRRHVISLLSDVEPGGEVSLAWLADNVAEIEYGDDFSGTDRKRVYVGLYQCHLPKMDALRVVRWEDQGPIVVTDRIRMLQDVMVTGESHLIDPEAAEAAP